MPERARKQETQQKQETQHAKKQDECDREGANSPSRGVSHLLVQHAVATHSQHGSVQVPHGRVDLDRHGCVRDVSQLVTVVLHARVMCADCQRHLGAVRQKAHARTPSEPARQTARTVSSVSKERKDKSKNSYLQRERERRTHVGSRSGELLAHAERNQLNQSQELRCTHCTKKQKQKQKRKGVNLGVVQPAE